MHPAGERGVAALAARPPQEEPLTAARHALQRSILGQQDWPASDWRVPPTWPPRLIDATSTPSVPALAGHWTLARRDVDPAARRLRPR